MLKSKLSEVVYGQGKQEERIQEQDLLPVQTKCFRESPGRHHHCCAMLMVHHHTSVTTMEQACGTTLHITRTAQSYT